MDERHPSIYSVVQGFPSMNPRPLNMGASRVPNTAPAARTNDGALFGYALNVRLLYDGGGRDVKAVLSCNLD